MATVDLFRRLALALPKVVESSHMNHPDFRVLCPDNKLRIFCTLSAEATSRGVLRLTPGQQAAFCEELPAVFEPVQGGWGRMGMTHVRLEAIDEDTLLGALTTAHRNVLANAEAVRAKRREAIARTDAVKGAETTAPKTAKPRMKK